MCERFDNSFLISHKWELFAPHNRNNLIQLE